MKDLKWLSIEDYANSPLELMVVGCMKMTPSPKNGHKAG